MKKLLIATIQIWFFCHVSLLSAAIIWQDNPDVTVTYDTPTSATHSPYDGNPLHNQNGYDYGDAPAPYGKATNKMGRWQMLGNVLGVDDGVSWSVGNSAFGTDAKLIRGEEVTFRFDFWQANNGAHDYDQLFTAIDWNHNGVWETSETLLYAKVDTHNRPSNDVGSAWVNWDADTDTTFYASIIVPETVEVGSTWLRARVHCNHTLYGDITPYNYLAQGETEDYQLTIVNPVPEPATMLLFGTGFAALVGTGLRRKKT